MVDACYKQFDPLETISGVFREGNWEPPSLFRSITTFLLFCISLRKYVRAVKPVSV